MTWRSRPVPIPQTAQDYVDRRTCIACLRAGTVVEFRVVPRRLVGHETDPCQFDHHGLCQAHGLHEQPCAVAEAQRLLADRVNANA